CFRGNSGLSYKFNLGQATVVAKLLISSGRNRHATPFCISEYLRNRPRAGGTTSRAQSSSDATSKLLRVAQNVSPTQQEEQRAAKSVTCRKQAKEQKLSGSKRRAFVKDCIRK